MAPLFWYLTQSTLQEMNLRATDIGLPYKLKQGNKYSDYEFCVIPTKGWKYKTVNIDVNFDKSKEQYYIALIEKLKKENIDSMGIKFQFSDKNTYKDLVGMINIMQKTNFAQYGLDTGNENSIYAVYNKPTIYDESNLWGKDVVYEYVNQKEYDFHHASFYDKLINFSPKGIYYIIFGYLLLVYSAILKPKLTLRI